MRLHGKQAVLAFFVGRSKKRFVSSCLRKPYVPALSGNEKWNRTLCVPASCLAVNASVELEVFLCLLVRNQVNRRRLLPKVGRTFGLHRGYTSKTRIRGSLN